MEVYQLFSKRGKVYEYDTLKYDSMPEKLRNQIYFIWKDALGSEYAKNHPGSKLYEVFYALRDTICREHGLESLFLSKTANYVADCEMYLKKGEDNEILLDLIELSMRFIPVLRNVLGRENIKYYNLTMDVEAAVKELNQRFKENGIGYEFTDGILIRKDSEILHAEVTKPALYLLNEQNFNGALDEFLKAHDHYRKGNYSDSILNAGKAFESTMKTIADLEAWGITGKENASTLIGLLVSHQVIPSYLQTTLQGLGTLRNNVGGHGQGAKPVVVPEHFVNYALHLCGTNIVMLIEAYKEYLK